MRLNLPDDVRVMLCEKHGERFIFVLDCGRESEVLQTAARWATDPQLSLTWYDVMRMAIRMDYWEVV